MNNRAFRKLHRTLAPIVFLPFFITAITGILYRIGNSWFGLPTEFSGLLMNIHQGSYLGAQLRPFYVLLNGLGLIGMLVTGIVMSGIFRRPRSPD